MGEEPVRERSDRRGHADRAGEGRRRGISQGQGIRGAVFLTVTKNAGDEAGIYRGDDRRSRLLAADRETARVATPPKTGEDFQLPTLSSIWLRILRPATSLSTTRNSPFPP